MNDHDFEALLAAVERGEPLPEDLAPDVAADLTAARLLFAARRPMPPSLTDPAWSADDAGVRQDQIAPIGATPSPSRATRQKSPRSGLFGLRWVPELALLALIAGLGALALLGGRSLSPAQGEATPSVVGTLPAGGLTPEVFAQWGGASYAVVADGPVAYLGVGPRVTTLDIGAGGEPEPRTTTEILLGVVHGLALSPDRLYAAAGTGLNVFERAANGDLTQRGSVDVGGPVQDVAVSGDRVYVAITNTDVSLVTVDVSNPAQPRQLGSLRLCDDIHRLAVHEKLVVAACGKYGVFVADVRDARAPKMIGSWDGEGEATDLALNWPYAYVAGSARVLDFTEPKQPMEVDTLDDDSARHVAVSGDWLILAGSLGLRTYDLAIDPTRPQNVGSVESPNLESPWDSMAIDGDRAFVAHGRYGGVDVFDLRDLAQPRSVGMVDTLGMDRAVAASAGCAYAVDYFSNDVRAFKVDDAGQHDMFGQTLHGIQAIGLAASGTTLFAGKPWEVDTSSASSVWRVWDVANLNQPRFLGHDSGAAYAGHKIAIANRLAIVAESPNGVGQVSLGVIDISNTAAPRRLGGLDNGFRQNPSDLVVADDERTVYIAENAESGDVISDNDSGALEIIDVSDPTQPHSVAFFATPREALGVAVHGNYAYVAAGDAGLRVIDVTRPDAPREAAVLTLPGDARDVVVDGTTAYVAYSHGFEYENTSDSYFVDDFNGVVTVDIADPTAPRIVHDLRLPGEPRQLALDRATSVGPVLWVAAEDAGLVGVRLSPAGGIEPEVPAIQPVASLSPSSNDATVSTPTQTPTSTPVPTESAGDLMTAVPLALAEEQVLALLDPERAPRVERSYYVREADLVAMTTAVRDKLERDTALLWSEGRLPPSALAPDPFWGVDSGRQLIVVEATTGGMDVLIPRGNPPVMQSDDRPNLCLPVPSNQRQRLVWAFDAANGDAVRSALVRGPSDQVALDQIAALGGGQVPQVPVPTVDRRPTYAPQTLAPDTATRVAQDEALQHSELVPPANATWLGEQLADGQVPAPLLETVQYWPLVAGSRWVYDAVSQENGTVWTHSTVTETVDAAWRAGDDGMIVRLRRLDGPVQAQAYESGRQLDSTSMFWRFVSGTKDQVLLYVFPGGVVQYTSIRDLDAARKAVQQRTGPTLDPARGMNLNFIRIPPPNDETAGSEKVAASDTLVARAGQFEGCTILSYWLNAGNMEANWLCPGVGVVRREMPRCGNSGGGFVVHDLLRHEVPTLHVDR
jgi:hypothetical protein